MLSMNEQAIGRTAKVGIVALILVILINRSYSLLYTIGENRWNKIIKTAIGWKFLSPTNFGTTTNFADKSYIPN